MYKGCMALWYVLLARISLQIPKTNETQSRCQKPQPQPLDTFPTVDRSNRSTHLGSQKISGKAPRFGGWIADWSFCREFHGCQARRFPQRRRDSEGLHNVLQLRIEPRNWRWKFCYEGLNVKTWKPRGTKMWCHLMPLVIVVIYDDIIGYVIVVSFLNNCNNHLFLNKMLTVLRVLTSSYLLIISDFMSCVNFQLSELSGFWTSSWI